MSKVVNSKRLKDLIDEVGENGMAKLAVESTLSYSTIQQLCAGTYPNLPKEGRRKNLLEGLGRLLKRQIAEKEIFNLAPTRGKAS